MSKPLEIFLLAGQSNMAGRGLPGTVPPLADPDILMFRGGRWQQAREPLHEDKPTAGIGLAMSFADRRRKNRPGIRVGLVPCAVGGTPLSRWMPGGDLYVAARATLEAARPAGQLAGVLWHQGCSDASRPEDAASYGRRLGDLVAALRDDLGAPGLPFIAGELGAFLAERPGPDAHFRLINDQLHRLAATLPLFGCAPATGLTDIGDRLHFDAPSLRRFGRRYEAVFRQLAGEDGPAAEKDRH